MDKNEVQVWVAFWAAMALVICTIAISITTYNISTYPAYANIYTACIQNGGSWTSNPGVDSELSCIQGVR